jgi:hypothetical protein
MIIVTQSGIVASAIVLLQAEKRTTGSIAEYTEAVRRRYLRALNKEKGRILDLFASLTGYHRKAVIARCAEQTCPGQAESVGILSYMAPLWLTHQRQRGNSTSSRMEISLPFCFMSSHTARLSGARART